MTAAQVDVLDGVTKSAVYSVHLSVFGNSKKCKGIVLYKKSGPTG